MRVWRASPASYRNSAELGLSPVAEKALHLDAAARDSHSKWLALANWKDEEVVTPAPAASAPAPASAPASAAAPASSAPPEGAANGTPRMPGFTSPA